MCRAAVTLWRFSMKSGGTASTPEKAGVRSTIVEGASSCRRASAGRAPLRGVCSTQQVDEVRAEQSGQVEQTQRKDACRSGNRLEEVGSPRPVLSLPVTQSKLSQV